MRLAFHLLVISLLAGCGEPLSGYAWEVTVNGGEPGFDSCNIGAETPYTETFDYVLDFSGADVSLGLLQGGEVFGFASGTLSGCDVSYETVIWQEQREGGEVRWQLVGEASVRQGGNDCNIADGLDWEGFEEITVIDSADPDVPPGCTYRMDATGTYSGEL
ncbi:MAG: hypothetical protein EP330_08930 [Deltaproteobacteria bacterium]|nr:MAG: hypothetical protein EP330_08930 [Deltaproteobacteria bacterium]